MWALWKSHYDTQVESRCHKHSNSQEKNGSSGGNAESKAWSKCSGQISNPTASYPEPGAHNVITWALQGSGSPTVYFWHLQHTGPLSWANSTPCLVYGAFPIRYTTVLASWCIFWHLDATDSTSALMRDPCKDSDSVTHFLTIAAVLGNNGPWSWIPWPPHHCIFHSSKINNIWTVLPSFSAILSYNLVSVDPSSISVYVRTLERTFFRRLI